MEVVLLGKDDSMFDESTTCRSNGKLSTEIKSVFRLETTAMMMTLVREKRERHETKTYEGESASGVWYGRTDVVTCDTFGAASRPRAGRVLYKTNLRAIVILSGTGLSVLLDHGPAGFLLTLVKMKLWCTFWLSHNHNTWVREEPRHSCHRTSSHRTCHKNRNTLRQQRANVSLL